MSTPKISTSRRDGEQPCIHITCIHMKPHQRAMDGRHLCLYQGANCTHLAIKGCNLAPNNNSPQACLCALQGQRVVEGGLQFDRHLPRKRPGAIIQRSSPCWQPSPTTTKVACISIVSKAAAHRTCCSVESTAPHVAKCLRVSVKLGSS